MKKDNSKKIILDLCGGSGAWGRPYKEAGYDVRLITLPSHDIRFTKIRKNGFIDFYRDQNHISRDFQIEIKNIYGILAAPPCTEFSRAKSTQPRDFARGMETIRACLEIIWGIQERHKLKFWALENPMGLLSRFLGNPPYAFKQWWFGNDRTKDTHLWGRFNKPKRLVFKKPRNLKTTKGYVNKKGEKLSNRNAEWYSNASAAERAITPEGFANAFYKANK